MCGALIIAYHIHGFSAFVCFDAPQGLTAWSECSTFVLMEVETLGVARSLGWKVHMRCADGYRRCSQFRDSRGSHLLDEPFSTDAHEVVI